MRDRTNATGPTLVWRAPADSWSAATPIGNGRLAAMVFGGTATVRADLNDSTVWSGAPDGPRTQLDEVIAGGAGPARLAEVRDLMAAGRISEAEQLMTTFEGTYSQQFLPLGVLELRCSALQAAHYAGRELDLRRGIVTERLSTPESTVTRTWFASHPDSALCVDIAVVGRPLDVTVHLSSPLRAAPNQNAPGVLTLDVPVDGAPRHEPQVVEPLRYAAPDTDGYSGSAAIAYAVDTDGAAVDIGDGISVTACTRLRVLLVTATTAENVWRSDPGDLTARWPTRSDVVHLACERMRVVRAIDGSSLVGRHVADQVDLLDAADVVIGAPLGRVDVAQLLAEQRQDALATVLTQYGRYLLVAASRPGAGPPANLQGIWNADPRPPWSSNYTININTQMNYWPAETAGLAECHEPLIELLQRLSVTGAAVARELYGCRGWVAHHNTDPWGWALPVGMGHGHPSWAIWPMGGAWLAHHVWEHYEFGRDAAWMSKVGWPILRDCARFLLDWLVDTDDGALDTVPSTSPENLYLDADGNPAALARSTTMDLALMQATFKNTLRAMDDLAIDEVGSATLRTEIFRAMSRLRPIGCTGDGRLLEWADDVAEADPHHRHLSPLVAVYPLGQIDPLTNPGLAHAARLTLDRRGPGAMGWSWAWKIALRARLGDGDGAADLLAQATRRLRSDPEVAAPVDGSQWGGLLPNLFSSHPPFQIDGNYGLAAAIIELLVQSQHGVIRFLPALPSSWPDGSARGIRCRGGVTADVRWSGGRLAHAALTRTAGNADESVALRYDTQLTEIVVPRGQTVDVSARLLVGALS